MKIFSVLAVFALITAVLTAEIPAYGEEIIVEPTGQYAKIDIADQTKAMNILKEGAAPEKDKLIAEIKAHPENFIPVLFYMLSSVLFEKGEKDEAAFWFYAGQLRGRYDANRCADISARDGISILNMRFGGPINQYMMQDIPKLSKLVERVVEWDEKTPHKYDQRWINLHGMGAIMSGLDPEKKETASLSLPESEWESIAAKTRRDYLTGFQEAMKELEKRKAAN